MDERRKIKQKSLGEHAPSPGHLPEDVKTIVVIGKDGKDPVAEIIADNPNPRKYTAVVTFGRFNPPHVGHLRLFNVVRNTAKALDADYYIIPSLVDYRTVKGSLALKLRYPLKIEERIEFINHLLPPSLAEDAVIDMRDTIIEKDGKAVRTPFQIFQKLRELGYKKVIFILGYEEAAEGDKATTTFNVLKGWYRGGTEHGMKVKPYFLHNEKVQGQKEGAVLSNQNMSARLIRKILMAAPSPTNLALFIKAYEGSNIPSAVLEGYYQKWHIRLTKEIPAAPAPAPPSRKAPSAPLPPPAPRPSASASSYLSALTGMPDSFRSAFSSFRQSSPMPVRPPSPQPMPVPKPVPKPAKARRAALAPAPAPRMGTRSSARLQAKA